MNILIENSGYHLHNLGDVAMLQTADQLLGQAYPRGIRRIFTTAPDRLNKFCPEAKAINARGQSAWLAAKCFPVPQRLLPGRLRSLVYDREKAFKFAAPERALKQIKRKRHASVQQRSEIEAWLEAMEQADVVLATGGGYFTDAFAQHLEGILHSMRWAQVKGKPTAFLGQGLGPLFRPRLKKQAAAVLRDSQLVSLRENASAAEFAHSCDLSSTRWKLTGDDAFYLLRKFRMECAQPAIPWEERSGIGLNIRVAPYSEVGRSALEGISKALHHVRAQLQNTWIPLPIDLSSETGDEVAIRRCVEAAAIAAHYQTPDSPEALWQLARTCRVVITGSYHAAVFALSLGIPVISLAANSYYRAKFCGLQSFFPEGLRMVNSTTTELKNSLLTEVRRAWQLSEDKRRQIAENASQIAASVEAAYMDCFNGLNG